MSKDLTVNNDADWQESTYFHGMRHYLQDILKYDEPSLRKARMYLIALLEEPRSDAMPEVSKQIIQPALEAAKKWLKGAASQQDLNDAYQEALYLYTTSPGNAVDAAIAYNQIPERLRLAQGIAYLLTHDGLLTSSVIAGENPIRQLRGQPSPTAHDCELLREVFGFRPRERPTEKIVFDPAWRTDTVLGVARQMTERKEFGGMPILADALQEAGCENEDILIACRETPTTTEHNWVLRLVRGEEEERAR